MRVKNKVEPFNIKGVVYQIGCNCGEQYIGETGRTLAVRMKEHKSAVNRDDSNNGISVHANSTCHDINWEGAKVIEVEENWKRRKYKEAIHIALNKSSMNLDRGLQVHPSWITCIQP